MLDYFWDENLSELLTILSTFCSNLKRLLALTFLSKTNKFVLFLEATLCLKLSKH